MKRKLLLAATGLFLAGCGKSGTHSPSHGNETPRSVHVQRVVLENHTASEEVIGTVRSSQSAVIEAKLSGRILQFLATPGRRVKTGDLLVELDAQEIRARLEQAVATLDQTDKDMARYKQLIASNAASRQDYDMAEARQKVAKAAFNEAETMMGYARVTAPFDGVVTRKLAEIGDLAMPGKPLLEMEAPGLLRFEAPIPEALLDRIQLGAAMRVNVPTVPQGLDAKVSEIAPVADAMSRTFLVKLDLPIVAGLRSGKFGRVSVPIVQSKILAIPREALLKRGQMEIVFVHQDSKALLRLVKSGKELDHKIEILSGLEGGEEVITSDLAGLKDGVPVKVLP